MSESDSTGDNGNNNNEKIKIKVSHGSNRFDLTVPSQCTFGDLKRVIAQEIGLEPKAQRLFFRGIEKEDQVSLHMAGVKNNSKLLLMENSDGKEMLEEVKVPEISRGAEAVAEVRAEDDKLAEQVDALKTVIYDGTRVAERDINFLLEMLERQLLKLDNINAEGEGKVQRKMEVCRVQSLLDTADNLKKRNSCPNINSSDAVSVPTNCETSEADVGTPNAQPSTSASTKVNQDWEVFE